jgi:hypothetical protein
MTAPTLLPVPVTIPAELLEVPCYFAGRHAHCAGTAVYWTRSHPAPDRLCEEVLLCEPCFRLARQGFDRTAETSWAGLVICGRCNRFFSGFDDFVKVVPL